MLEAIQIEHEQRQGLRSPLGHKNFFVQLHFERTPVVTAGERISQRLLLDLREQSGMVDRNCDLIRDRAQQQNFAFMPDARRIVRLHLQRAHQAFVENERRYRRR